ncbi:spheroidene monooxygenase [Mameliella alba]|uniref:spheroidene monooxygenase n=1 Tax=Mameliella alba TaxID=561184 RepID=UPI001432062E
MQVVSLSLFRFPRGVSRLWALAMMGLARPALRRTEGIGFWKLCGSGTGEGFTPLPETGVYAILATWPDLQSARRQTRDAPVYRRYHRRAEDSWTLFLSPVSARGAWSRQSPFEVGNATAGPGPIAALTRATLRVSNLWRFWRRVPDISAAIGADPAVTFKIGIGEVPLLHQVTFSIWPDSASMARFARADGPHARAIRAVREGDWFREELYARFRILGASGHWPGGPSLTPAGPMP